MAEFPTYEEMAKNVAEKALDEFMYNGKSIREWMQIITSEDCISRERVLEQINCWIGSGEYRYTNATEYSTKRIKSLPSVTPKPDWIPVSERLPKNDEDVLVCYPQGGMEVAYYHIDDTYYPTQYADLNETGWFNENGDALYFEPIAWMPLPKPYESEDKE